MKQDFYFLEPSYDDGSAAWALDPERLRFQAARCRRLADTVLDQRTVDALTVMGREYEQEAERLSEGALAHG